MTETDLRWIVEGPRPASDVVSSDSPIDADLKRSFDALWISSIEARTIVTQAAGSRIEAEALLREAMAGGTICTRGVPGDVEHRRSVQSQLGLREDDDFQKIPIQASYWAQATNEDQSKWNWQSGEFVSSPINFSSPARYFDVEFPILEINEICIENGFKEVEICNPIRIAASDGRNKGGRPSDNHGEAIAHVTINLLKMGSEFNKVKAISLSYDLKEAYEEFGRSSPSDENLKRISSGILRAVRRARDQR